MTHQESMSKKTPQPTNPPRERAFLVGVDLYKQKSFLALEDSLTELALLSDTSGLDVVGELTQKLDALITKLDSLTAQLKPPPVVAPAEKK